MRKANALLLSFMCLLPSAAAAQQPPADAKAKAEAEARGRENMNRMAAEQAAAEERARLKVQQDAAIEAEARARREQEKSRTAAVIPVDVDIVVSRFQGDKKISSLPYALTVNASTDAWNLNQAPLTQLRMGGQIPVPTMAPVIGPDGKPFPLGVAGGGPVQYRDVGTEIDCRARTLSDGRFELFVSVFDSAVATPQGADASTLPVIRTFKSSNNLVLRDGQTRQFTAAADRITGEIVRVDVTLRVAK